MHLEKSSANPNGVTRPPGNFGDMMRTILLLGGLTFGLLVMVGLALLVQMKLAKEPLLSMKGLAPAISSHFFGDMLHMEIPGFAVAEDVPYTFSKSNVLAFLTHLLTDVNPRDPKSVIAGEIPGIREDIVQLRRSQAIGRPAAPADYAPIAPQTGRNGPGPEGAVGDDGKAGSDPNAGAPTQAGETPPGRETDGGLPVQEDEVPNRQVVFIYHSHNRESWIPELEKLGKKNIKYAEHAKTNITLVGRRLAEQLEKLGIGTMHSDTDYAATVKNYNWNFSYKYSQATVRTAMAENGDLVYFFDIHRDSQHRELTTIEIGGVSYAQVYFVVGLGNPDWEKNEAFATAIHEALEERYPGLSRGIWGKGKNQGNGEYNQSLSPNSLVIEIGGPENTLEESYRTADALAGVIADIYREAERVSTGG